MVWTLRQASRPPRAAAFFATISAPVGFAFRAHPAANSAATIPTTIVATARAGTSGLRFGEGGRIQFRVHGDPIEDDLVRLRKAVDDGLDQEGNLQPPHRAEVALVYPDLPDPAVHPPGDALDLHIQEGLGVDEDTLHGAGLGRQLELVGIPAIDFLEALDLDLGSLPLDVDQRVLELGVLGRGLRLLGSERLDVVAVEKRAQLPAVGAVIDLHRGLARELDLEARLVGTLPRQLERQLHLLLGLALLAGRRDLAPRLAGRRPRPPRDAQAAGNRCA